MGRSGAGASLGWLPVLIFCAPFLWLYGKCSGAEERRARERGERDTRAAAERERASEAAARERARREAQEAERLRLTEQAQADEAQRLSRLRPVERANLLRKCVLDGECPLDSTSPTLIIAAAKTPNERKQLEGAVVQFQRVRDRTERMASRASAPLRCCDGTNSPSCTCGNPRRGCCSHHGGVCGCSAD